MYLHFPYLRFPYMRFPSLRNALFRTCVFRTCVFQYLRFQRPHTHLFCCHFSDIAIVSGDLYIDLSSASEATATWRFTNFVLYCIVLYCHVHNMLYKSDNIFIILSPESVHGIVKLAVYDNIPVFRETTGNAALDTDKTANRDSEQSCKNWQGTQRNPMTHVHGRYRTCLLYTSPSPRD